MTMTADELIAALDLQPHPEGGHFKEIFRDVTPISNDRTASTAIYYLLKEGESSHWHRIDAAEVWHHYAGAPLQLDICETPPAQEILRLGKDIQAGEQPVGVVPPGAWQAAKPLGAWSLVGCTVAPSFDFAQFEMAPPGWTPTSDT